MNMAQTTKTTAVFPGNPVQYVADSNTPTGVIGPVVNPERDLVKQIYPIVNSVFEQMTGRTDLQAVDTASLVAMGCELGNLQKHDVWFNTLARRIGHTIDGYRVYRNRYSRLYRTQIEWGAAVQKLTAEMPDAVADPTWDIGTLDGKSVDQWIINNPKVHQRIFDKETPYSFFITISTKLLKDAFLSEEAMSSFINQIFGKVRNKIEFVLEELARIAVNNFVLNLNTNQEFHLVTIYNSLTGNTVTTNSSKYDADFLRWAIGFMQNVANKMETMSVLYNSDRYDRFTTSENREFYMLSDFMTQLNTVVSYSAYNPGYVTAKPDILIPYWQGSGTKVKQDQWDDITTIKGTTDTTSGRVQVTKNNLIAIMFDIDAIGTFRDEEDVLTTPVNARARYYNTFWHERQMWFNDMSENGVAFYLD